MINNYTKLSTSNDTWLKNGKGVARGIPPGARTKASNTWLVSMMMFFLLLVGDVALAQVSYTQAFTSNAGSWTGNFSQFTGTTACGGSGGAMRRNLYGSAPTGELISPNLGTSNGTTLQTITYAYKAANWSANTVGTNPWGSFDVQYGSSATGPWTTIATV